MFPSPLLVWLFVLPATLSVAALYGRVYLWPVLGVDLLLLAAVIADFLLSRNRSVTLGAEHRDIFSLARPNPVTIRVHTEHHRLTVLIRIDLDAGLDAPDQPIACKVRRGTEARVTIHVFPSLRGERRILPCTVRIPSALGLLVRQSRQLTARPIRVYPDLAQIRSYELLARQHRQNALVRASRMRGGESEFARLRDYTTDDNYRFVDWKATARRNKLTTREFQLESDQNVVLLLDSGRLMTAEVEGITQFDLALGSSLLLCHVAARGGDRVGLLCFDEEVRAFVLPEGGPKATSRLVQASYDLFPRIAESGFQKAFSAFDARVKQRSLVVLFTQLIDNHALDELCTQLGHLSRRHLALVVILEDTDLTRMALGPSSEEPTSLRSSARELYLRGAAAELLNWKAHARHKLRTSGAHLLEVSARDLSAKVINRYLELKAQRAL